MTDMDRQITGTRREVADADHPAGQVHTVSLRRTYDAPVEDVWSACTEAERLGRWFLPVSGELRLGGHYQLEGNAGGEILVCEPPRHLVVTWIFGEAEPDTFSEVEVRLSPTDGGATLLELEHRATVDPEFWNRFGPGAVGVGWDLGLLGLDGYLAGTFVPRPEEEILATPQGRDFVARSGEAWRAAHEAAGADPAVAKTSAEATVQFYLPPEEGDGPADADAGAGADGRADEQADAGAGAGG
jgi:uncharacterized protein YndB with AHSA1/START domain